MKQKFYSIDADIIPTLVRRCPVCKKEVRKDNADESDYELLACLHCGASFQYDREKDSKDIYRYELISN